MSVRLSRPGATPGHLLSTKLAQGFGCSLRSYSSSLDR